MILLCMPRWISVRLFFALSKKKVPIVLINGRISDTSYSKYQKIIFLLKEVLADVRWAGMQTEEDVDRIVTLGVPKDRALVMGNMKFDGAVDVQARTRSSFGYREDDRQRKCKFPTDDCSAAY